VADAAEVVEIVEAAEAVKAVEDKTAERTSEAVVLPVAEDAAEQ
jgi:hypothetical protein